MKLNLVPEPELSVFAAGQTRVQSRLGEKSNIPTSDRTNSINSRDTETPNLKPLESSSLRMLRVPETEQAWQMGTGRNSMDFFCCLEDGLLHS